MSTKHSQSSIHSNNAGNGTASTTAHTHTYTNTNVHSHSHSHSHNNPSLPTLSEFLTIARNTLREALLDPEKQIHIVTGNESCDLDSFAAAVVYGYFFSLRSCSGDGGDVLRIPILPILRKDLSLRPEFEFVLGEIGVQSESESRGEGLLFLDDFDQRDGVNGGCGSCEKEKAENLHSRLRSKTTSFTLVDHNVLDERFSFNNHGDGEGGDGDHHHDRDKRVKAIIDHHVGEDKHLHASPRIITPSGSCSSLVVNYLRENNFWPTNANETNTQIKQLAILALSAILIDTANLTQKVTPHDTKAVEFLEEVIRSPSSSSSGSSAPQNTQQQWNRTTFFQSLSISKSNIDSLSLRDIFRKDYKQWKSSSPSHTLGISSTTKPLSYLLSKQPPGKQAFKSAVRNWTNKEQNLDIWGLMTAYTDPQDGGRFCRELILYLPSGNKDDYVKRALEKFAEKAKEEEFGLEEVGELDLTNNGGEKNSGEVWKVYKQGNVQMSRKQVAPALRSCL